MQTIQTADGRTLQLHEAGAPGGLPVIVHHGTPGSGVLYDRWATPGVRLIAFDRAGYGGSTARAPTAILALCPALEGPHSVLALDALSAGALDVLPRPLSW